MNHPALTWWILLLPFLAGSLVPLQAGVNGQLARHLGSVLAAGFISFVVGTLALLVLVLASRELPGVSTLRAVQWWQWVGGLFGAFFIVSSAFAAPRTGAALFMALLFAGQLSMSFLLDHFGWAGFRQSPLSPGKIAGLLLIVAGIVLIRRS